MLLKEKKKKKEVNFFFSQMNCSLKGIADEGKGRGRSKEAQLNEKLKTYILIYEQLRGFQ